jgi:GTP:adenosylcobinamide-phosphate guanylyltransferase
MNSFLKYYLTEIEFEDDLEDPFEKIKVSLSDLILVKKSIDNSFIDVFSKNKKTKTKGLISVWQVGKKYLIVDGWHRFVEMLVKGKTIFEVQVVGDGYSDYWKTNFDDDEIYDINSLKDTIESWR